jgi:predicted glycoside hydrolase/deacetylase ChbG (UPF0249 family)
MKYCIVNADDFGAGNGINRGVIKAHTQGIITSASLMVNMPASEEAVRLSRELPNLSIGLHVNFTNERRPPIVDLENADKCRAELEHQLDRFQELTGRLPTHIDSHHNVHRYTQLLPHFQDLAKQYNLPLRGYSTVRYFSNFYGQWDGETHLEQISVEKLVHMLEIEFDKGITELSCHPGYVGPDFQSAYSNEREVELQTLCDPAIKRKLSELQIVLVNYQTIDHFLRDGFL